MRTRLSLVGTAALALFLGSAPALAGSSVTHSAAKTYEHLANVIIEMNAAEYALVETILYHHHDLAVAYLAGSEFKKAAAEVTNIASEGDKKVQAVRQRLLKAGHHHHSDAETEEDYMFVDAAEKKALLDLAGRVGRGGDAMTLTKELDTLFQSTMAAE